MWHLLLQSRNVFFSKQAFFEEGEQMALLNQFVPKLIPLQKLPYILMSQLLYFLHNSPVIILLNIFHTINSLFFLALLWKQGSPWVNRAQLQHPKTAGGIAFPHPWLYYIAAKLQRMVPGISIGNNASLMSRDATLTLFLHFTHSILARGSEFPLNC